MRKRMKWLAMLLVFGLIVAACGSDSADTTEPVDTTEPMADMEIATDFGVDMEAGEIRVGMLSDLTGPFGPLVSAILAGTQAYWDEVNANGGINGLQVELVTRDTQYVVDNHIAFYEEIKDQVVAIGHSTGSPHTVAINADLQADGMLAIPLTWYSGWSDPAINSNLVPHGQPYCLEAHNTIGYILENVLPDATTIAIASLPGDYGQDSATGAKLAAEAAGLNVVYDGEARIIPSDESSLTEVANGIVDSGAEIVWVATTPTTFASIYGQTLAAGFQATWSGPSPSFNPAFVAPDSAIKDAITRDFIGGTYTSLWSDDATAEWRDKLAAGGLTPLDYYFEGIVEATILHEALKKAYDDGDMTRAGVLAAAKSLENVDFGGLAPSETYVGEANDRLQRKGTVFKPDPEGLAAGTSGGSVSLATEYTSDLAANFEFTGACYVLEG